MSLQLRKNAFDMRANRLRPTRDRLFAFRSGGPGRHAQLCNSKGEAVSALKL